MNKKIIVLGLIIIVSSLTYLTAAMPDVAPDVISEAEETKEYDDASMIHDLKQDIDDEAYGPLREFLEENKAHTLSDGSTLADQTLSYAIEVLSKDASHGYEGIKIALECGADPNKQLDALLKIKTEDHLELFLLELCIKHGAKLGTLSGQLADLSASNPMLASLLIKKGVPMPEDQDAVKKIKQNLQPDKTTVANLAKAQQMTRHITLQQEFKKRVAKKSSKTSESKTSELKVLEITSAPSQTVSFLRVWFDDKDGKRSVQELVTEAITKYYSEQSHREFITFIPADKIAAYKDLSLKMIAEEQQMQDSYVFYHAHDYALNLIFDINKIINEWLSINVGPSVTLRVPTLHEQTLDEYINHTEKYFQEHPIPKERIEKDFNYQDLLDENKQVKWNVWDNYATYEDEKKVKHSFATEMLSVSPTLFGNIGREISEPFLFFTESFSVLNTRKILNTFFDAWGFDKRFIPELLFAQYNYLQTVHGGGMIQIFVPKAQVDRFVFLAHSKGTPYRDKLTDSFDEKKHRHTTISDILEKYINSPFFFNKDVLNRFEARLVFLPDFFTSTVGVVYKTYDFAEESKKAQYARVLNDIVQRMIVQWISSGAFEKLSGDNANKPAIKLLQLMKTGEKFKEKKESKTPKS